MEPALLRDFGRSVTSPEDECAYCHHPRSDHGKTGCEGRVEDGYFGTACHCRGFRDTYEHRRKPYVPEPLTWLDRVFDLWWAVRSRWERR